MYILEGNIGVGKSTFLSLLKKHCQSVTVITEPVEDWSKQTYGQSLLESFYSDTPRWAYTLETLTMICRARDHMHEQGVSNPNRIFERSIYSGHYCFAQNSFESGCMLELEWKIYNQWANFLIHQQCAPPLGFIYLKASPETCFSRVQKRNRSSEKALTLDYMKQIDLWHDRFLIEKKEITPTLKNVPVLTLDCNKDFVENPENMAKHAQKVKALLEQTQPKREAVPLPSDRNKPGPVFWR